MVRTYIYVMFNFNFCSSVSEELDMERYLHIGNAFLHKYIITILVLIITILVFIITIL